MDAPEEAHQQQLRIQSATLAIAGDYNKELYCWCILQHVHAHYIGLVPVDPTCVLEPVAIFNSQSSTHNRSNVEIPMSKFKRH
jgi:hypothetical protein